MRIRECEWEKVSDEGRRVENVSGPDIMECLMVLRGGRRMDC